MTFDLIKALKNYLWRIKEIHWLRECVYYIEEVHGLITVINKLIKYHYGNKLWSCEIEY